MHVVIILAAVLTATSASAATCEFGDAEQCPKLCEAGDVESCYFHARMLGSGNQVPQDAARAQQMFIAACRKAHPDACNAVAHSKLDEGATFLDVQPWFEMGCAFGSSKACNNMGSLLRRESYGRQKESLGFFVRSCTLGAMHATTGCVEAGNTLRDGKWGTAADSKRAAELYAWGCALGDERQ